MDLSEQQIRAMETLFDFQEAMEQGNLSINDLADVMVFAIESGHVQMGISLTMAQMALETAKSRTCEGSCSADRTQ